MNSIIIMVVIKNDAMKAILKTRGVKGYSSQTKEGLVKMIEESGGFPTQTPSPSPPPSPTSPKAKRAKKVKVVEEVVDISGCVVEVEEAKEEAKVEEEVVEVKVKKTRKARPKPIEKFEDEK